MTRKQYGSASAQDLYRLCIRSGVLNMPWWNLIDDDDFTDDDWYVVVDVGTDEIGRRRLDAARLWMAILACSTGEISSVSDAVIDACRRVKACVELSEIDFGFKVADEVMQVALYGQVHWRIP